MAANGVIDGLNTTEDWQRLATPIAVLPVGAFEQHGPHLPLLTDTLKVEHFARYAAQELGAALLPSLSFCQSLEHSGFRGSISLRPETFMAVIRDMVDELERQNFTRLIIVNGHGGNSSLGPTVRDINRADRPIKVVLVNSWECDASEARHTLREGEVHAGAWETSVMLALFPELVGDFAKVEPSTPFPDAHQSDLNHVGPIVAPSPQTAQSLATAALTAAARKSVALDVPAHSSEWINWLRDLGFAEQRPFMRMFKGANTWPGVPSHSFAISGPEQV